MIRTKSVYFAPAALILLSGCSSRLESLDDEINSLVAERSTRLGTASPARALPADDANIDSTKTPDTRNPAAEALVFKPADEARDVAKRLESFNAGVAETSGLSSAYASDEALDTIAQDPAAQAALIQDAIVLDLAEAWRTGQRSAPEYLASEEQYLLSAISLLIERHQWSPRLSNTTSATLSGQGEDGRFDSAVRILNDLAVTQKLPYGGDVQARWLWDATEQLREQSTGRYRQSSSIALDASIPLMRGAGLIAQESLIQAERNLVYGARTFERARRQFLVDVATDYFSLLQTQASIRNQVQQLKSLRTFEEETAQLVKAGRKAEFDRADASNRVLSGMASLENLREQYRLQLDRFKVSLGLPVDKPLVVGPLSLELPEPDAELSEAAALALELRLDLQNRRDQTEDARRNLANAKNGLLPGLDVTAGASVPTDGDAREGGVAFDPDDTSYDAGLRLSLPLDRRAEQLRVKQAAIAVDRSVRDYSTARDNVVLNVRAALRAVDLARFQLRLAEQQVQITQRRRQEQEIKKSEVDTRKRLEAESDLLDALNARDRAVTQLRTAVLRYLLETDTLRVKRDGTFEPLPGMEAN
ncbi:MAG: TolC family protein [Phycisphaerae bacterium]|nr:TolC family protein [Phycisphaerae bacterium]